MHVSESCQSRSSLSDSNNTVAACRDCKMGRKTEGTGERPIRLEKVRALPRATSALKCLHVEHDSNIRCVYISIQTFSAGNSTHLWYWFPLSRDGHPHVYLVWCQQDVAIANLSGIIQLEQWYVTKMRLPLFQNECRSFYRNKKSLSNFDLQMDFDVIDTHEEMATVRLCFIS